MRAALVFAAALTLAGPASAARTILVRFADPAHARLQAAAFGDRVVRQTSNRVAVVRLQRGETAAHEIAAYRKRWGIVYAEPNRVRGGIPHAPTSMPGSSANWPNGQVAPTPGCSVWCSGSSGW